MQISAEATLPAQLVDGYTRRRRLVAAFFLVMCAFRDAIFVTGPIFVFRLDGTMKSGGLYGTALLFGGMLSFLVMGYVIDRLGWRRVAFVSAAVLALANAVLAGTALGAIPYARAVDLALLVVVFFCGSAFYLIPDVLINRYLEEQDQPGAYSKSGSFYPAVALMITSAILFGLERVFGDRALGLTLSVTASLAVVGFFLVGRLSQHERKDAIAAPANDAKEAKGGGIWSVASEWLSGFRFIASEPSMRLLMIFNCAVALALAPHNVFITAILKSAFALDDGGVAVAQFVLASVEVTAAWAFPIALKRSSLRAIGMIAVSALAFGNGLAAVVLYRQEGESSAGRALLAVYITAHVAVFVGLTFATAWMRMVRGKATPIELLGRTAGAMSMLSQLCGLAFSVVVTFAGAAIATHFFYVFCVALTALVGAPAALAVARRVQA